MAFTKDGIKKLAAHHGLDPEVNSDSDIDDCIKNAVTDDEMTDLANRAIEGDLAVAELDKQRGVQADIDLKTYANRIGEGKEVEAIYRPLFISNRAATIAAIEKIPAPARKEPLHNRQGAGNPKTIENGGKGTGASKGDLDLAVKVKNRALEICMTNKKSGQRADYGLAHRQAMQELVPVA